MPDSMKTHLQWAGQHEHAAKKDKSQQYGMSHKHKKQVLHLCPGGGCLPKLIRAAFENHSQKRPPPCQLSNILAQHHHKECDASSLSESKFQSWCQELEALPDDPFSPFCIFFQANAANQPENSQIFAVPPQAGTEVYLLCADFTYEINLHRYPIVVLGTCDKDWVTHPLAIGVCSGQSAKDWEWAFRALGSCVLLATGNICKPHFLVVDAAPAATLGFQQAFGKQELWLMYFFHVQQNLKSLVASFPSHCHHILSHIEQL